VAEKRPQTFANHTRLDPPYHFFVLPLFGLVLLAALIHFFAHITHGDFRDHFHAFALILLAFAFVVLALKTRLYALKVQDRVIRLEERLRLSTLLPEPLRSRIPELTEDQLVARLAERAISEKLSPADIKKAIQTWRPDYWRV